jgi:hypothetical protein
MIPTFNYANFPAKASVRLQVEIRRRENFTRQARNSRIAGKDDACREA